jgi:Histidine kinase/Y_Y_Y domain
VILFLFQILLIISPLVKITANGANKPFTPKHTIQFSANEDDIRFFFTKPPKKIDSFTYKLEGFDKKWITTQYPEARYTRLNGGDYTFNIKFFANGKTIESFSQNIIIENELMEEWWFVPSIIIYIVLLISVAIYFFLLYNLRQKVKVQAIRNRIATDLHDEVGSTLNSIAIFSRLVEKKTDKKNLEIMSLLDKIKTNSEETISTIRDTVWAINPDNDSVDLLFEKMRSVAYQILTAEGITLNFVNKIEENKSLKMSMEQRRNVYLIFKEAINNIVKHAQATEVNVGIERKNNEIKLSINDNGKGFETNNDFEGNGLKNYQKRANEGFLSVSLSSEIGKGTAIEVLIPEI